MLDFLKFWKKSEGMPKFPDEGPPDFGAQGMPSELPPEVPGEFPGVSAAPGFEPTSAMAPEQPPVFGREPAESPRAFEQAEPTALSAPSFGRQSAPNSDKEFQLINAKLDSIKASIDGLHQRLDKMEIEKQHKEEKDIYAWR